MEKKNERPPAALYKSPILFFRKLYIFCITILLAFHPGLPCPLGRQYLDHFTRNKKRQARSFVRKFIIN